MIATLDSAYLLLTVADRLDAISKEHCVARRAQLIEDATTQLDDAKQTYSEQKAEAERQFAQAEQKLTRRGPPSRRTQR